MIFIIILLIVICFLIDADAMLHLIAWLFSAAFWLLLVGGGLFVVFYMGGKI